MNAIITKIETRTFGVVVSLEWSGPDEYSINDFDLSLLGRLYNGAVHATGGTLRSGWCIIEGECQLSEWDTIPLLSSGQAKEVAP
jgi:hypothetical protein